MQEEIERILVAIASLREDQRFIVLKVCVEGAALHEAAEAIGVSDANASRILYRARRKLREMLARGKRPSIPGDRYPIASP